MLGLTALFPMNLRPGRVEIRQNVSISNKPAHRMTYDAAITNKNGALISLSAMAGLLFVFGVIAQIVSEGKTLAFDRKIILALHDPASPSAPVGPAWLQEAARDLTSLGSIVVLVIITLIAFGYLLLARKYAAAWLTIGPCSAGSR